MKKDAKLLASGSPLSAQYKDHALTGNLQDFRECHIEPDWLLMYQIHEDVLILSATATGSHADFPHSHTSPINNTRFAVY